jgi:hypothetical protein
MRLLRFARNGIPMCCEAYLEKDNVKENKYGGKKDSLWS